MARREGCGRVLAVRWHVPCTVSRLPRYTFRPTFLKPRFSSREFAFVVSLILVVLGSRLPFVMHGLDEWDSSNFALSVVRFDVLTHQPHPPGQYFYVRLMQLINLLTGNELLTLSLASAVCGSLALVPFYLALRQIFQPKVAAGAVVLTAFTFGFWITSLRMVSDPVACLFVHGVVCCLLIGLTDKRWFLFGMVLCGVALGVKQTAVYFLAPFVIAINLVVLMRGGWRHVVAGSLLFSITVAAWLLPTAHNCHGWKNYVAICQAMHQENYLAESIIFQLSARSVAIQARQNFLQPWGDTTVAIIMLALAVPGFALCLRRRLPGMLYALFSLSVILYAFFFLYRFNKYYVYYLPFYGAFAAATLFSAGEWLADRLSRQALREVLPWTGVAVLTTVNVCHTWPLLADVSRFRAPPQNALENLRAMPGVGPTPLLLTDNITANRELLYFHLKGQVDLLNRQPDLQAAVSALNAGHEVYFLSSTLFRPDPDHPDSVRLLGSYVWPAELYQPLQGGHDLRQLSLYRLAAPLPVQYDFANPESRPPLLMAGMWEDGWCGADSRFVLPCDPSGACLAHLRFTAPENFGFRYPYRMVCHFTDGSQQELLMGHAGRCDFTIPLPNGSGARGVQIELVAPQTAQPWQHDPHATDRRDLSVLLNEVDCVTESTPLIIHREEGWYDLENDADHRWRWIDRDAAISILSVRAGTLVIEGSIFSSSQANAVDVLVDDRPEVVLPLSNSGSVSMTWHLPVEAGYHRITIHSRNTGVQSPGENRRLALRMQDLQIRFDHR